LYSVDGLLELVTILNHKHSGAQYTLEWQIVCEISRYRRCHFQDRKF